MISLSVFLENIRKVGEENYEVFKTFDFTIILEISSINIYQIGQRFESEVSLYLICLGNKEMKLT
jgi:hypothetical protein